MSKAARRYGEQDQEHYDRPRRRTRPRTKDRPSYDDAVDGTVLRVDRGRLRVRLDDRSGSPAPVTAMKARPLGRKAVVVGDRVRLVGDTTGDEGSLARIVEIRERGTTLRRTADDEDPIERIVVANADQLVVVASLADPEPRARLIDRAVVAAYVAGMEPLLCLTKADLASPDALVDTYRALGVPWVVARRDRDPAEVRERLAGRVSVLVGPSGVGKSTLVNALVPGADRETGGVNTVTGRGRHTSTQVLMLPLPPEASGDAEGAAGWIVDTPGIRSFGLAHVGPDDLLAAFTDLDEAASDCPRGCDHAAETPECALDTAVAEGRVEAERVDSFRRLLAARPRAAGD